MPDDRLLRASGDLASAAATVERASLFDSPAGETLYQLAEVVKSYFDWLATLTEEDATSMFRHTIRRLQGGLVRAYGTERDDAHEDLADDVVDDPDPEVIPHG